MATSTEARSLPSTLPTVASWPPNQARHPRSVLFNPILDEGSASRVRLVALGRGAPVGGNPYGSAAKPTRQRGVPGATPQSIVPPTEKALASRPAERPHQSRKAWLLRRMLVVASSMLVVPTILLFLVQDRFVFETSAPLRSINLAFPGGREISYMTEDGATLAGWYRPGEQSHGSCELPATAVLLHGQGGNRSWSTDLALTLSRSGVNVFIAEYRGYGGTVGDPSEDNMARDARAAVGAALSQPGVTPDRLVYVGYSLGAGVAVRLAVDRPPAALLLLAPYTSLPDIAWDRLPGLPYNVLMRSRFDALSRVATVEAPVMVVVTTGDTIVPNSSSERLWAAVPNKDGFVTLDGVRHEGIEAELAKHPPTELGSFIDRHATC